MDKLVIDIETSNTFAEVGGRNNLEALNISLIGVYSYAKDAYLSFTEDEIADFGPLLKEAGLIIGFAINRFDIPVLNKHYPFNLFGLPRLDILDDIEMATGSRISLNLLAEANLGLQKTHHGLEAIRLYREGNMVELRDYCLNDVKLTKELYDLGKRQGYLAVPNRKTGETAEVAFAWKDAVVPARLF
jgi:DEAD/DEAH box helicase domain-containing protein